VALLRKLGSLEAISAATPEELVAAGATSRQARAIIDHLRKDLPDSTESEEVALENAFVNDETPAAPNQDALDEVPVPQALPDDSHHSL
jgi:hypothetical protein